MSEFDSAIEAIKGIIDTTWTQVVNKREGSAVQEFGWRELIQNDEDGLSNTLKTPFATLNWGEEQQDNSFGHTNRTWRVSVVIGYITSKKSGSTKKSAKALREEISGALKSLSKAILDASGTDYVCYRVGNDSAETNAANTFFDTSKFSFRAGFVRAEVIFGYST